MVSGLVLFVHRHGDRSPWAWIPGDEVNNASWPDGLGQLTALGMQQTHLLGSTIRERYSVGNYSRYEYYVRSTDYDRTLQSAQCVLAGVFPPGSGPTSSLNSKPGLPDLSQPIPIHTVPRGEDSILRGYGTDVCPALGSIFSQIQAGPLYSAIIDKWSGLMASLRAFMRIEGFNLWGISRISDTLLCEKAHNLPLLPVFQPIYNQTQEAFDDGARVIVDLHFCGHHANYLVLMTAPCVFANHGCDILISHHG